MNAAVPLTVSNSDELSSQKPWPGLRAFTESDSEFFFGREREAVELLSIVKRAAVMVNLTAPMPVSFHGRDGHDDHR